MDNSEFIAALTERAKLKGGVGRIESAIQEYKRGSARIADTSLGDYSLDITDLSQILDPYSYAADYLDDQTVEGKARYLHMLEQGKYIQQMQMAAYQNWYNSAEQVAKREREAGLNPDLVGLEGAESATASASDGSGVAGLTPTDIADAQIKSQRITNLTNILTSVGGLVGTALNAFSSLSFLPLQKDNLVKQGALTEAQKVATRLGNIGSEKALFQFGISSKLAGQIAEAVSAGTESEFDYDAFFGSDLSSVFNTYTSGSAYSQHLFDDVLANREVLKNEAIELAKQRASGQIDFSRMAGSKYYNDDVVLTAALVGPLMTARLELEENKARYQKSINDINLRVAKARESADVAKSEYDTEFYTELDAEKMAQYEFLIKSNEAVKATLEKAINDNLKTIYFENKDNMRGFSAAWMYNSGASSQFVEYLAASELMISPGSKKDPHTGLPNTGSAFHDWAINPFFANSNLGAARSFVPTPIVP